MDKACTKEEMQMARGSTFLVCRKKSVITTRKYYSTPSGKKGSVASAWSN